MKYYLYICSRNRNNIKIMKHQVYNGYPEDLSYVCRKGESDVWLRVYVARDRKSAKTGKFFSDLESHGYDIYNPSDGFNFNEALSELNEACRRDAIKNGYESYNKVKDIEEICRCGKWIFLRRSPSSFSQLETVEIEKGRGGRREGSGRKSNSQKLVYGKTTTIRVPSAFKDNVKELCDYLIERSTEGVDVRHVLLNASSQLHAKAEDYKREDYKSELTESWRRECEQAEAILLDLRRILPFIHLKEEDKSSNI